jgi:hypothetical protein
VTRPERPQPPDASTPDLESLDAAWEEEKAPASAVVPDAVVPAADADADGADERTDDSQGNLDDLDEGWETVPDPKGGPPERRRVSPKERARRKRDKQRAKAEAAASKQKGKGKRRPRRDDAEGDDAPDSGGGTTADASPVSEERPARPREERRPTPKAVAAAKAAKATRDVRTLVMIAVVAVGAAAALYFMMTSR